MTVMRYPAGVRWLDYQQNKSPSRRLVSRETLRLAVIAAGGAAVTWGLMHLALRLLG